MSAIFIVAVVVAVLAWLILPRGKPEAEPGDAVEPVDAEELEAAENEVRDLDLDQRPGDGFEGDDWGPGVGRR